MKHQVICAFERNIRTVLLVRNGLFGYRKAPNIVHCTSNLSEAPRHWIAKKKLSAAKFFAKFFFAKNLRNQTPRAIRTTTIKTDYKIRHE